MGVSNDHQVTFRAGRGPSESPEHPAGLRAVPAAVEAGIGASSVVLLADISEFQHSIADPAYLRWSQAIVIRAAYGAFHTDQSWFGGQRRDLLLAGGARFLGLYQYLVAGQDPAAQAKAMVSVLGGKLNPGEVVICDIEEGGGSQRARWDAWSHVIETELGDAPWNYSGAFFAQNAGIAPVDWVAAYGSAEPGTAHKLWQFTDAFAVPGIGTVDCSVYHGTIDQLAALAHGGTSRPVTPPAPATGWTETLIANLTTLTLNDSGEDVKSAQGLLAARGYPVTIDGAYGVSTRAAVTALQHAAGLSADGITGPLTWKALLKR
jgi:hypothetical protein